MTTQPIRSKPDDYWKTETFVRKYVRNSILGRQESKPMKEFEISCFAAFMQGIMYLTGNSPKSVLDMGCGHATRTSQIKANLNCRVVGADYSEAFLNHASMINAKMPDNAKIELTKADVYDLPFGDNEFDVGICYGLYMSLSEPERSDLLRVCRYGIVMIEESPATMDEDQLTAWSHVREKVFPGRIYWHDYLKLFGRHPSVVYSPIPVPKSWDAGTAPGYARVVVVKELFDAQI